MTIPILCETEDCPKAGEVINEISGIEEKYLDLFYEDFDGTEEYDRCPACGNPGIADDAKPEEQ